MKEILIEIGGTVLGAFIMAIGVSLFLLPNQLSTGGVSGIATITYYLLQNTNGNNDITSKHTTIRNCDI